MNIPCKMFAMKLLYPVLLLGIIVCADEVSDVENSDNKPITNSEYETLPSYVNLNGNPTYTNVSQTIAENVTLDNATDEANVTQKYVACLPNYGGTEVQLVNDTELIKLLLPDTNITSKDTPGKCICVLFYSKYCPFSSLAAPHFNALPRAYPDIKMLAINAMMYHLFNTQNGIIGVPSVLLFHNGKIVAKFNESDYTLEQFSRFMTKNTGIGAEEKSFVVSADFTGPVSSVPSKDCDGFLICAWLFIIMCSGYYFTKSKWWQWMVEWIQHNWRESEAQHQHVE